MKIHLNEAVHRVISVVPLKRRSEPHRNACGVNDSRYKDICRRHCADKRIVRNLFGAFYSECRNPRGDEIYI